MSEADPKGEASRRKDVASGRARTYKWREGHPAKTLISPSQTKTRPNGATASLQREENDADEAEARDCVHLDAKAPDEEYPTEAGNCRRVRCREM